VQTGDPRAGRVVGFVFLTVFLDLVGFGIIIPLLPFYVKSMSGSAETVGFILASFSFTQLVATPFLGRLSDRLGRRPVILISLAGNTAGNLAACQAAIADVTQGEARAAGMGRLGAGIGLGMVLGPVLGSSVSHFGAWAPPLAAAGMALADLVAAFFFMPETHPVRSSRPATVATSPQTKPDAKAPETPSLWRVLTQRRLLIVLVLYFLTFLYMTNMQVALALLTNARLGWTAKQIGNVFGLFGLIMLVVQGLLIGRMTRAWGAIPLVVGGSVASMLGLATIAVGYHAVPVVAGLLLLGAGLGIVNPCLSSIAADYAGRERAGTVLGFAQSCGGLARTVGPVLGGLLYARVATGAPFLAGALAALLAGVLGVALLVATRRASADAALPSAR
jgi:DHA1 family tetracycline resistance protein-like MFS transporter